MFIRLATGVVPIHYDVQPTNRNNSVFKLSLANVSWSRVGGLCVVVVCRDSRSRGCGSNPSTKYFMNIFSQYFFERPKINNKETGNGPFIRLIFYIVLCRSVLSRPNWIVRLSFFLAVDKIRQNGCCLFSADSLKYFSFDISSFATFVTRVLSSSQVLKIFDIQHGPITHNNNITEYIIPHT